MIRLDNDIGHLSMKNEKRHVTVNGWDERMDE